MRIICYDSNNNPLKRFYQWDTNQTISISGIIMPPVPVFHFCNRLSQSALVVTGTVEGNVIKAPVPNALLEQAETIVVYIYEETPNDGSRTTHTITIPVIPRPKPNDYNYIDNIEYPSYAMLDARINEILASIGDEEGGLAELSDMRIGVDGTKYQTAGEAMRSQLSEVVQAREDKNGVKYVALKDRLNAYQDEVEALSEELHYNYQNLSHIVDELINVNLNDYKTAGTYRIRSASDAETIQNIPENVAGRLTVMVTTYENRVNQTFVTNASVPKVYIRYFDGTKWNEWNRFTNETDILSVKDDLIQVDRSADSDCVFHLLDLKQVAIDTTTGEVDAEDTRTWSDEAYYEVLDIREEKSILEVPNGYYLRCYYYDENKDFQSFNEARLQTLRFAGTFKYVRFSIRKSPTHTTFDLSEIRNSVIIAKPKTFVDSDNSNFNKIVLGNGKIIPDFRRGYILDGVETETYDYYSTSYISDYIETADLGSVTVPEGYKVAAFYFNSEKEFTTSGIYTSDFLILKQYKYVRIGIRKSDYSVFNIDLEGFVFNSVTLNEKNSLISDKVDELANATHENLLTLPELDKTTSGITISTNGNGYIVEGKATSDVYFVLFESTKHLISGVVPGKKYLLEFTGFKSRVNIQVRYYDTNGEWNYISNTYYNPIFTIPENAVGIQIRIYIQNGWTIPKTQLSPKLYFVDSVGFAKNFRSKKPRPMITIIYDDGEKEFDTYIMPIIAAKKVPISTAIITEYVGQDAAFMNYEEIVNCYNNGAEILTHTLAMSESSWKELGYREISMKYLKSKRILENHGMHIPSTLIYSGGSGAYPVCYKAAQVAMNSAITAGASSVSVPVTNYYGEFDSHLISRCYSDGASVDTMKSWIDDLVENGTGWQIWMRHNTQARASMGHADTAEQDASKLSDAIDYATQNGIDIVTVERGLNEYLDM